MSRHALLVLALLAPLHLHAQPASVEGTWRGTLSPMAGVELRLVFHIHRDEAGLLNATMDSPDQGATGLPVQQVTFVGDSLDIQMPQIQGRYRGVLAAEDTIRGTWTQMGQEMPMDLIRGDGDDRRRPQEPRPPFPYLEEEVRYPNSEAGIHLAGTLTLPEGPGPFPAVALITGSGPQDRDETIMGHKPFWVLADHLTRRGIAVLRSDDRGVGESEGDFASATTRDFAGDADAAAAWLRKHREVDPDRVGLIGHSEGGIIAPMVAVERGGVAFTVLLAGPALPGEELLYLQGAAVARAMGQDEDAIQASLDVQEAVFQVILEEEDPERRRERAGAVLREYLDGFSPEERRAQGIPEGGEEAWIQSQLAVSASPWFRYFLGYDPRAHLERLEVPVLALFGELDLQVPPAQNLPAMEEALTRAGSPDATVLELPGLNHLFQTAETGSPMEYARIEETFAPAALEVISDWILERFGARGPRSP
jgi:uncharacterized protein